jgi:hypothetical protein
VRGLAGSAGEKSMVLGGSAPTAHMLAKARDLV